MAEIPSDDTTLDPLEIQDQEELHDSEETPTVVEEVPVPEITEELEAEIKQILVVEEPSPKKAQMIPQDLIDRKLTPDDLMDPGSI